jgi:hypothetical protein
MTAPNMSIDNLPRWQFRRVVTAFESRMRKLKASGDYPEAEEDKKIHEVLVLHLYKLKEK